MKRKLRMGYIGSKRYIRRQYRLAPGVYQVNGRRTWVRGGWIRSLVQVFWWSVTGVLLLITGLGTLFELITPPPRDGSIYYTEAVIEGWPVMVALWIITGGAAYRAYRAAWGRGAFKRWWAERRYRWAEVPRWIVKASPWFAIGYLATRFVS